MTSGLNLRRMLAPDTLFYLGLSLVLLSLWMFFIPDWLTFIHVWRVELFASVFLLLALSYIFLQAGRISVYLPFSSEERRLIFFPMLSLIALSAMSATWAVSWKSSLHHALVWSEYVIFYVFVRILLERHGEYRRMATVVGSALLIYSVPAIAGYCALAVYGGANTLGIQYARFGEQVVTISPLLLVGIVRLNGRRFVVGTAAVVCLGLMIFCSFGRANYSLFFLGTVAVGLVLFSFRRYQKFRKRFSLVVGAIIIATTLAGTFPAIFSSEGNQSINRFSDKEGLSASNNFRKLMWSLSIEMFLAHPVNGIGADNFGFEVNNYRGAYAGQHPDDVNLAQAENEIPERAHNEYLQVAAELGIVGLAIFGWFLFGIARLAYRATKTLGKRSPFAHAAVIGIGLFLISSLVTSYSFRLIQNGFVFFFVLAVAAKLLYRSPQAREDQRSLVSPNKLRMACCAGVAICSLLITYSSLRLASVIVTKEANYTAELDDATKLYQRAMTLDDENPFARQNLGIRLLNEEHYSEAANYLNQAVTIGLATSTDFSYLASARALAGDNLEAERALERAALLYPRSVFVLTRYAVLLQENGRSDKGDEVFSRAVQLDPIAANTWKSVITEGPRVASERAVKDKGYIAVMDLQPQGSIYAVVMERLIKFPEERKFSMMSVGPMKRLPNL